MRKFFVALFLLCGFIASPAQEPPRKAPSPSGEEATIDAPDRPAVTRIGEHLYRIGEIEMDSRTREIRLPVVVNMREGGPIEYVLVHETGKVHESVFVTPVPPLHLQVALQLLKYRSGHGDVFNSLLAPEMLEEHGGEEADRGEAISVRVEMEGGEAKPAASTIIDGATADPMTDEPWTYTGSTVEGGVFMAEAEGSILAIYLDHLALFNMTREGADQDDRWGANSDAIPEIGTQGTLVIAPAENPVTN